MSHPVFAPCSAQSWRNPWPMYRALRTHSPVHHVDNGDGADYYVLSRHADVAAALREPATFSSATGLTTVYGELERTGLQDNPPMVMQDPPNHTQFRRLVSRGFTPRQVSAIEPAVRDFVVTRIERLRAEGGGDIVASLFKPLPSMVVAHYLGVPEEDRPRFDDWTERIVGAAAEAGTDIAAMGPEVATAIGELMGYFGELVQRRRREPGDDTVSHLVAAGYGADGDTAGLLSILGFAFTMVTGGNDTTTGMLGGATELLARHRDQWRLLAGDPGLIPDAVEEFLRLTSPVQGLARTVTRDTTIEGVCIPAGRKALLLYASANRDERVFGTRSEELDVTRRPREILTFAQGNHHCLGAAAARMQSRVALHELLTRLPDLDVDPDSITWAPGNYVRRPLSLQVRT
ncbi:Cytochrome P450 OS=Tsukamurella paurometabola (strain ATCC 8368 / DSM / CCUG 35730 / CIP 100753/ JCM 10117 / KCTC 9821 / NBRC 16120 / NCIMB 702349 / NCTC 13040) OX=521096 GN=Tpau_3778 PE=3 SV=1 [Tsukamurella paurometabola]|uniref:Cytochrome P450 n=2 Tax=Tsukamurella paurometabola TaxID=2061 RepID=D5UYQ3_TSUPD|nr:cytochrome P450 [Tsukamurella paurometabola DSM 20162]SUP39346.1 Cytochrome P450 130 [Tsukamurella paurometabola]